MGYFNINHIQKPGDLLTNLDLPRLVAFRVARGRPLSMAEGRGPLAGFI